MAPPLRPPAPVDAPYVDLRATSPDSDPDPEPQPQPRPPDIDLTQTSAPDIDLTESAPAAAHPVELVEAGAFAHAACSACGWTGPARRSRTVALADRQRHP